MSLWNRLIQHPGFERVKTLYNEQFPLEVRFVCAEWIEERIKTDLFIDINDPQIEQKAANFLHTLIQQLENEKQKLKRAEELSIKYRLDEAIQTFTQHLYHPFAIYKQIRDAISYEQHFLENFCDNQQINYMDQEAIEIKDKLKALKTQMQSNKEKQTKYKHDIENYKVLEYSETSNKMLQLSNTQEDERRRLAFLEEVRQKKCLLFESISARAIDLYQSFATMIVDIDGVQKTVILKRLGKWQRDQALAGNGAPLNGNTLDEIQTWFEVLGEVIWNTRLCIEATREINSGLPLNMNMGDVIERAYREITTLLQNLIVSGFIVEKQPPQVMKTNTRFAATVRLLTVNLGIQMNNPSVVVSILSESQSQAQQQNHLKPLDEASGEILNNTGNLEMQQSTRHLSCNLRNMQLKKIKRAEKKGTESVMDEKFALLFKSTFQTADIRINVWVMSLPVVVIVHGNQEPQSWATITWDNAFSEISRVPFHVVDKVNWSHMVSALNMKFTCQTGRGLTAENLYYLCEKAFRTTVNFDPNDRPISWSQFCKEPLPERTFTFWDWFYAVMKLTRDQLRGPWTEGLIIGFINKRQAEEKLLQCPPGTFLLRFSDSELGGITIAWVENAPNPQIVMLQPFCSKDFGIRSLGDRIKDLPQCVTLYPDIPKDSAFGNYYSPIETTTNGYVKPILKTTVPDDTNRMLSNPNTPQHSSWQSPDHTRDTSSVQSMVPEYLPSFDEMNDDELMFG
ncbi:signal transducer and activator of transcription 5A-like isoform X2 [Bradysia coprophila]|uniref:signal transducer and activator of transcription 5A-like isoform X2 n=1 Tax=Bradysia coprophila TaxID=38358 RepID=UPI00187D7533|nr:signal transducer and activator of transcription 5A-like isoform X2 [Bradysia coprophila]